MDNKDNEIREECIKMEAYLKELMLSNGKMQKEIENRKNAVEYLEV